MEVIVKFNGNIYYVAESVGGSAELLSADYAVMNIERSSIPLLYGFTEIEDIELPKKLFISTGYNLTSSCIRTVQNREGLSGNGVIVAVIDSGIDYTHIDFRNEDGSTRILCLWDQTIQGNAPSGFNEGTEYTESDINAALSEPEPFDIVPSRDIAGHGTAVAGIAAGNGRSSSGENTGVAPQAYIIAVKVGSGDRESFALTTELMRAVKYVIDKAQEFKMPVAINLSFGMNNGSHKGDSLFEEFLGDMADEWKTSIIVPTGNEGSAGHHYSGKISSNQTKEIEFFSASGIESFYISLWSHDPAGFGRPCTAVRGSLRRNGEAGE